MIRQKDPRKRGRASRNKGAEGERNVAKKLQNMGHADARRGQVFNHQPDIIGVRGVLIEVKNHEKPPNIWNAYAQAKDRAAPDEIPVAICHYDYGPYLLAVDLDDYGILKERL